MNTSGRPTKTRHVRVLTPGIISLLAVALSVALSTKPQRGLDSAVTQAMAPGDIMEVVTADEERFYFFLVGADEDGMVGEMEDGQIVFVPFSALSNCRRRPTDHPKVQATGCTR